MRTKILTVVLLICGMLLLFTRLNCPADNTTSDPVADPFESGSDASLVANADESILFVGNSHTSGHQLPKLVCDMINFRFPKKHVYASTVSVSFLEDTRNDPRCRQEIESRNWKTVVLQAQKISVSGKFHYSQAEGIELAKLARSRNAKVFFFSEWAIRGNPENGVRHEKIYQEMATASDAQVAAVDRAWRVALAVKPDLPLYDSDGNHQTATGAYLTAAFLFGRITGEDPRSLASFPYQMIDPADRTILLDAAMAALSGP